MYRILWIAAISLLPGGYSVAADFSDPGWPCIQRKVKSLSLGIMWPGGRPQGPLNGDIVKDVNELANRLALRRTDLARSEELIANFAALHKQAPPDVYGHIFVGIFDQLSDYRKKIIGGIEKYAHAQIALSQKIDRARGQMAAQMAATSPDFETVDRLEEQVDWDERIYRERARSLTYVCETPVLLEKRAYAIAQLLRKYATEPK